MFSLLFLPTVDMLSLASSSWYHHILVSFNCQLDLVPPVKGNLVRVYLDEVNWLEYL